MSENLPVTRKGSQRRRGINRLQRKLWGGATLMSHPKWEQSSPGGPTCPLTPRRRLTQTRSGAYNHLILAATTPETTRAQNSTFIVSE